jgi:hypothetical protein
MLRTLLAKRLRALVTQGLIARREGNRGPVYELTNAGEELAAVIEVRPVGYPLDEFTQRRGPRPRTVDVGHAPSRRSSP